LLAEGVVNSMPSFSEIERLVEWAKTNDVKIEIKFKGYPYRLHIYKLIRAVDPGGRFVPWSRAFGPKQPHQVLETFPVEKIVLAWPDGRIEEVKRLKELFERV